MKITSQQALVMFDICKGCLYSTENQFAGYSKKEIMNLLNDIINQQDNKKLLNLNKIGELSKTELSNKTETTGESSKNDENTNDDFWKD